MQIHRDRGMPFQTLDKRQIGLPVRLFHYVVEISGRLVGVQNQCEGNWIHDVPLPDGRTADR